MTGLEKNFDSVCRPSPSRVIMTDPLKGFGLLSNLTTAAPEGSGATRRPPALEPPQGYF